jgi:hypothetical protein
MGACIYAKFTVPILEPALELLDRRVAKKKALLAVVSEVDGRL